MCETNKKGSDPVNILPQKNPRQWVVNVAWVSVAMIPVVILLWLLLETRYEDRFLDKKIADKGSLFLDLRLNKIEQLGGKTFIVTAMSASVKQMEDPEQLTVKIGSKASKRTNTYRLLGQYNRTKKHFRGMNDQVRIHPISGSPSWFPFDDLSFDISLTIKAKTGAAIPDPPFSRVHLYQEQEGARYVFKNTQYGPITNVADQGAKIHIKFLLTRKLFAKIAFIVYASLVILYIILTLHSLKKFDNDLVMSLIGFFISIWAARQGLNSFSTGHITIVDYFFLIAPMVVFMVILAKLVIYKYSNREPSQK